MKLTPGQSIRKRCLDCAGGALEVRTCVAADCVLHKYRMGRGRPRLRLIRQFCIWCMGDQPSLIRICPSVKCHLWPYRMGKRPKTTDYLPENDARSKGFSTQNRFSV